VIRRCTAKDLAGGRGRIGKRLHVDAIAQAFKRVAKCIKMPGEEIVQVSGYSIWVGATQIFWHRASIRPLSRR
jgi:hypothetical protein